MLAGREESHRTNVLFIPNRLSARKIEDKIVNSLLHTVFGAVIGPGSSTDNRTLIRGKLTAQVLQHILYEYCTNTGTYNLQHVRVYVGNDFL